VDSDGDGLTDDMELNLTGTDPFDFDTDHDEYSDFYEVGDPFDPADVDDDGIIDALESFVLDRDGDDIPDEFDAVQLDGPTDDRDGDGVVNITDPDDDNDGICDPGVDPATTTECTLYFGEPDNCPYAPEPPAGNLIRQVNTDANLVAEMIAAGITLGDQYDNSNSGDACDWDADGDMIANPWDNCPTDYNPSQADEDFDGWGDACDSVDANANIQTNFKPFECIDSSRGGADGCDLLIEEVAYNLSSAGGATVPDLNRDGAAGVTADEMVEIRNVSGVALDLSGFELHDWASFFVGTAPVRHIFPPGTVLRHNRRVVVFGGGTPGVFPSGVLVQKASSGTLGLSNGVDVVVLVNPQTLLDVAFLAYGDTSAGEPSTGPNVSLSRYPDGIDNWVEHPLRRWSLGGQMVDLAASPGSAPDNDLAAP
jgi:hypothetical protein